MNPPNINPNPKSKHIVLKFGPGKTVQAITFNINPTNIAIIDKYIFLSCFIFNISLPFRKVGDFTEQNRQIWRYLLHLCGYLRQKWRCMTPFLTLLTSNLTVLMPNLALHNPVFDAYNLIFGVFQFIFLLV
jgi:hypothetical protein